MYLSASLQVLVCALATTLARPEGLLPDQDGYVSVTQSSAGTYKYQVHLTDSFRSEERRADGTVVGEYSLFDEQGRPIQIKYTAGPEGFKIVEGPVLLEQVPVPTHTEPDVIPDVPVLAPISVRTSAELVAPLAASTGTFLSPVDFSGTENIVQVPVDYTPEVKAAREEHLALHKAALLLAQSQNSQ